MENVTRILVIRFSSIGDIVLTTPVLRVIKNQLQGKVELHYLTKKKFASILEGNPNVDRVHTIEKTVQEVLPELEKIEFDYIIDLHNNVRTSVVKRRLKSLAFTFRKLNLLKWLWVNFGINRMPVMHIVDRYLETLRAFSIVDDGKGLEFYIPQGKGLHESQLPHIFETPFVAFAIGGMHIGKKMSKEKMATLCSAIKYPVILVGGKEEKEDGDYIAAQADGNIYNACGAFTLHESADAIQRSALVVSGDTGMMHIASAFGKKIISLWGCTVPGFGMYPYRPHPASILLEPKGRTKRPCSKLGNRCKYGTNNRCIEHIDNNEILKSIEMLWAPETTL